LDKLLNRAIKGIITLGKAPHKEFKDNMVPVDYVSRAIIHLSRRTELLGKTFHLTNYQLTRWNEVLAWFGNLGYPLEWISYTQWWNELRRREENALFPLMPMFHQDSSGDSPVRMPQFDCRNTTEGLADTNIVCPTIDAELFNSYFSYLTRSGFLEEPPPCC